MSVQIGIEIDDHEVMNWVKNIGKRTQAKRRLLKGMGLDAEHAMRDQADMVSTTGSLRGSIHNEIKKNEVHVDAVGYASIAMETGRRPGKMPPVAALKRWARLKLGDERLAFLVARKIAAVGTKRHIDRGPKLLTEAVNDFIKNYLPERLGNYLAEIVE